MIASCEDEISGVREVTRYQEGAGGLMSMSEQVFVTQSRQHQDGANTGGITSTNIGKDTGQILYPTLSSRLLWTC